MPKRHAARNPDALWWIAPAAIAAGGAVALFAYAASGSAPAATQAFLVDLANGPFPAQHKPSAVVLPAGLTAADPLDVWIYFRGVSKCVERVLSDTDGPCAPGGRSHKSTHLLAQFAASGSKALLIVPELRFDAPGMDAGALTEPGRVNAMLAEVLRLPGVVARIGARSPSDVRRLGVMAHSGGVAPAAAVVAARPVGLASVVLLDALYRDEATFASWVTENARRFGPGGDRRIGVVWTDGGGTDGRSRTLAETTRAVLETVGLGGEVLDDRGTGTLTASDYQRHAVFKRSALAHEAVSTYYPAQFWEAGW